MSCRPAEGLVKVQEKECHVFEVMGIVCVVSVSQHVVGGNGPVVVARPAVGAQTSHRPELLSQRVPGPAAHAGATCRSKHSPQKGKRSIYTPVHPSWLQSQWKKLEIENPTCRKA